MTNVETRSFVVTQDKTQDTVANYVTGETPGNRSCQDLSKNELLINMVTLVYVQFLLFGDEFRAQNTNLVSQTT